MTTYTREPDAFDACRVLRRQGYGVVVVDGPGDAEWTLMSEREAIDHGFAYTWSEY